MRHAALFFLSICLSQPACPGASADTPEAGVSSLVQQARANNLARDPYWLALLHYRTKAWRFAGDPVSEITSADFFLSPQGATDPDAELAATLTGLFKPAGQDPDAHAQCRFVARHQWLRKSLDWGSMRPPAAWRARAATIGALTSIATGASMRRTRSCCSPIWATHPIRRR